MLSFQPSSTLLTLADPAGVTNSELAEAYLANALFGAHRDDRSGYRFLTDEAREAGFAACDRTMWRVCSDNGWWPRFGKKQHWANRAKAGQPPPHPDRVNRGLHRRSPEPTVTG